MPASAPHAGQLLPDKGSGVVLAGPLEATSAAEWMDSAATVVCRPKICANCSKTQASFWRVEIIGSYAAIATPVPA